MHTPACIVCINFKRSFSEYFAKFWGPFEDIFATLDDFGSSISAAMNITAQARPPPPPPLYHTHVLHTLVHNTHNISPVPRPFIQCVYHFLKVIHAGGLDLGPRLHVQTCMHVYPSHMDTLTFQFLSPSHSNTVGSRSWNSLLRGFSSRRYTQVIHTS